MSFEELQIEELQMTRQQFLRATKKCNWVSHTKKEQCVWSSHDYFYWKDYVIVLFLDQVELYKKEEHLGNSTIIAKWYLDHYTSINDLRADMKAKMIAEGILK